MNFYIADLHLGHENILKHCHRPFETVEEMDETIIHNWNSVVGRKDDVYILGDVGWKNLELNSKIAGLNGYKHLVIGNHDRKLLKDSHFRRLFVEIHNTMTVRDNGVNIVLFHYPIVEWDGLYQGSWHFYGHIHNNHNRAQQIMEQIPRTVNVGADCIGFTPKTARELMNTNYTFQNVEI